MTRITRRMIFGMTLGLASTAAGLAMAAPPARCRALCTERSWAGPVKCGWAGPIRKRFTSALSDAERHQNLAEHVATIEILLPCPSGAGAEDLLIAPSEPGGAAIDRRHGPLRNPTLSPTE
jgi:hypothetical protein